jgi:hypothetical protein
MARSLFEVIRDHPRTPISVLNVMRKAQVINADNISHYYYIDNDRERWSLTDHFPNIVPPFPVTWVEWKHPHKIVSEVYGEIELPIQSGIREGLLVDRYDLQDDLTNTPAQHIKEAFEEEVGDKGPPLRWICSGVPFRYFDEDLEIQGEIPFYMMWFWGIQENGLIWFSKEHGEKPMLGARFIPEGMTKMTPEFANVLITSDGALDRHTVDIAFLTFSFMHCKNVVREEIGPGTRNYVKRNRHNVPRIKQTVLKVVPMKEYTRHIRATGNIQYYTGGRVPVHIRRGHFRDYTKKGLFGKHKGIFWFDMTTVGVSKDGKIEKTYVIETKNSNEPENHQRPRKRLLRGKEAKNKQN